MDNILNKLQLLTNYEETLEILKDLLREDTIVTPNQRCSCCEESDNNCFELPSDSHVNTLSGIASSLTSILLYYHEDIEIYALGEKIWRQIVHTQPWLKIKLVQSGLLHNFVTILNNSISKIPEHGWLHDTCNHLCISETTLAIISALTWNVEQNVSNCSEVKFLDVIAKILNMKKSIRFLSLQIENVKLLSYLLDNNVTLQCSAVDKVDNSALRTEWIDLCFNENEKSIVKSVLSIMNAFLNDSKELQIHCLSCLHSFILTNDKALALIRNGMIDSVIYASTRYCESQEVQSISMQCLKALFWDKLLFEDTVYQLIYSKRDQLSYLIDGLLHSYASDFRIVNNISYILKSFLYFGNAFTESLIEHHIFQSYYFLLHEYHSSKSCPSSTINNMMQTFCCALQVQSLRNEILYDVCTSSSKHKCIENLLLMEADINYTKDGCSILQWATFSGDIQLVDGLLSMSHLLRSHSMSYLSADEVKHCLNNITKRENSSKSAIFITSSLLRYLIHVNKENDIHWDDVNFQNINCQSIALALYKTNKKQADLYFQESVHFCVAVLTSFDNQNKNENFEPEINDQNFLERNKKFLCDTGINEQFCKFSFYNQVALEARVPESLDKVDFKEHLHIAFDKKRQNTNDFLHVDIVKNPEHVIKVTKISICNANIESVDMLFACEASAKAMQTVQRLKLNKNNIFGFSHRTCMNLKGLEELYLQHNAFTSFPINIVLKCLQLKLLDISNNQLTDIQRPVGLSTSEVHTLILHHNNIEQLPFQLSTILPSLVNLDISYNNISEIKAICDRNVFCQLTEINLSHNNIKKISSDFLANFPRLSILNFSWNDLTEAEFLESTTSGSVVSNINISHNALKSLPRDLLNFQNLKNLDVSYNEIQSIQNLRRCNVSRLKYLDLSHNKILDIAPFFESFAGALCEKLHILKVNHNKLSHLSPVIGSIKTLEVLSIKYNNISKLPNEIGKLAHLYQLELEGNPLSIPPHLMKARTKEIVSYFYSKLKNSVEHRSLRMLVVDYSELNHEEFLNKLTSSKPITSNSVGTLRRWNLCFQNESFDIDLCEIQSKSAVLQSHLHLLFCNRQVVLLLFDIGQDVNVLSRMLLALKSYTPHTPVCVVGMFDEAFEKNAKIKDEKMEHILKSVKTYIKHSGFTRNIYCILIEKTKATAMDTFINKLGNLLSEYKVHGSNMFGNLIPKNYQLLIELLSKEANIRKNIPVIRYNELIDLIHAHEIALDDGNELLTIMNYFRSAGFVLYYDDPRNSLRNYFVLDPMWIFDATEKFLSNCKHLVKEASNFTHQCMLSYKDITSTLKQVFEGFENKNTDEYKLDLKLVDALFQLLINNHICIPVNDEYCFIPALFVESNVINKIETKATLTRIFAMDYVPPEIWIHISSRILSYLPQLFHYCFDIDLIDICDPSTEITWHENTLSVFHNNNILFEIEQLNKSFCGVKEECFAIYFVPNTLKKLLPFIVDEFQKMIEEHFEDLLELDMHGDPHITQYSVCPVCVSRINFEQGKNNENACGSTSCFCPMLFDLNQVGNDMQAVLAKSMKSFFYDYNIHNNEIFLVCPNHKDSQIAITDIVPDLCISDIDKKFELKPLLLFMDKEKDILGEGGFGTVFKGNYKGDSVAVKLFRTGSNGSSYKALRDELNILAWTTHPSMVSIVGYLMNSQEYPAPLLVMKLSHIGSLSDKIKEVASLGIEDKKLFFPRLLRHKMMFEIADGLKYLHDKNIIFRDLKPDNVLIFSMDYKHAVTICLTDFGVAVRCSKAGTIGASGSPGYSAPEVVAIKLKRHSERLYIIPYNKESDIFSFGLVSHEIAVLQSPWFEHDNIISTDCDIPPNVPDEIVMKGYLPHSIKKFDGEGSWPYIQHVISSCLKRNPDARLQLDSVIKLLKDPLSHSFRYSFKFPFTKSLSLCSSSLNDKEKNHDKTISVYFLMSHCEGQNVTVSKYNCSPEYNKFTQNLIQLQNPLCKLGTGILCISSEVLTDNLQNNSKLWSIYANAKYYLKSNSGNLEDGVYKNKNYFFVVSTDSHIYLCEECENSLQIVKEIDVGSRITCMHLAQKSCFLVGTENGIILLYALKQVVSKNNTKMANHSIDLTWFAGKCSVTDICSDRNLVFVTCAHCIISFKIIGDKLITQGTKISNVRSKRLGMLVVNSEYVFATTQNSPIIQVWSTDSAVICHKLNIAAHLMDWHFTVEKVAATCLFADAKRSTLWVGSNTGHIIMYSTSGRFSRSNPVKPITVIQLYSRSVLKICCVKGKVSDVILSYGQGLISTYKNNHMKAEDEMDYSIAVLDTDLPITAKHFQDNCRERQRYMAKLP